MTTPLSESSAFFASSAAPTLTATATAAGPGYYPNFPSFTGLGYYPAAFRDSFPSLRARFDGFGYSVRPSLHALPPVLTLRCVAQAFIPEGTFKVEEARLQALKDWSLLNQKREEERLKTESLLESHILTRAKAEADYWQSSLTLLDLQRQIADAQLAKAKDTTLDKLVARRALAEAERAEAEKQITVTSITRRMNAEAEKAEAEVALVKCTHKKVEKEKQKLDLEMLLVQAQVEAIKAQKAQFDALTAKATAEAQLIAAQAAAAGAAAAAAASAPPPQQEVKQLLTQLEKMDPCSGGYAWVDRPDEGGFRCEGGSHFKSYADARAFVAAKKK